jgi:hypothetical protein
MKERLALLALAIVGSACGGGNGIGSFDSKGDVQSGSCLIPSSQLVSGGPGRDGIPALTNPRAVSASAGDQFLAPGTRVVGVAIDGQARAYPHNIFWWHEIANDTLAGKPIVVSYCPLTGSALVYDATVNGQTLNFGVSGLLFNNNLVLFDRATESLWSQMRVQGVCGRFSSVAATLVPVVQSTWAGWKALHPDTSVLTFETGFARNYNQYPYGNYDQIDDTTLLFPQADIDPRRPMKELVLGVRQGEASRAYPYGALGERAVLNETVAGRDVLVVFDRAAQMALAFDRVVDGRGLSFDLVEGSGFPFLVRDRETGTLWDLRGIGGTGPLAGSRLRQVATYSAMWFAWAAFNRGTDLYLPS